MAMGPPHIYLALAVLSPFRDIHTEETPRLKQLKDMIQTLEDSSPAGCTKLIPMMKITKTYKEDFKVRFNYKSTQDNLSLCLYFSKEGGMEKVGNAPRGRLAREVQKYLERK